MKSHWPISVLSSISALINMLLPLVLVRILGADEIGQYKIFFLYLMMLPAFAFTTGLTNGLSYWAGQGEKGRAAIRTSGRAILFAALGITAILFLFRKPLGAELNWDPFQSAAFALALFGAIASTFYEDSAIALGHYWRGAIFNSASELLRTASILVVAILTHSLHAIFAVHVVNQFLKAAIGYALAHFKLLTRVEAVPGIATEVWKYAFPVSLAWVFGVFQGYSDQFLLTRFISPADFAAYAVGCLSVPPITILEFSVTRVLIPQMSKAFADQDAPRAALLYRKAVEELGFLLIPAATGLVVFALPIILLLFTAKFAASAIYLRIFGFAYLGLIIPYDSVPRARGQARWILGNFIAFAVLSFVSCYFLIKQFGPMGAMAGLLISKFSMRGFAIYYISRSTDWKIRDYLPTAEILRFSVVSVALGLASWILRPCFSSEMKWFFVVGPIFAVLYFVLVGLWSRAVYLRTQQSRKVLMLTPSLMLGGLERMILNLSVELKEHEGWEPRVLVFDHPVDTPPGNHLAKSFEAAGIPVELFAKASGFSFKAALKVAKTIKRDDIAVLHTHDLGALIYGAVAKILVFGQIRLIHTQHSFVHLDRKKRYRTYEKIFTRFADELTVVSADTRATYLELGLKSERVKVVSNGVRFPRQAPGPEAKKQGRQELLTLLANHPEAPKLQAIAGDTWILYLARLHGGKGQASALPLWGALSKEARARAALLFVGLETEPGQLAQLRSKIEAAPDHDRVLYLGPSQVPQLWLQSADIFLSCSESEGMPLGPIEAAGAGLPLVLSQIPGHEVLTQWSLQYDLKSPEKGARMLETLITSSRSVWREAEPLRKLYSLEEMAKKYAQIYDRNSTSRKV